MRFGRKNSGFSFCFIVLFFFISAPIGNWILLIQILKHLILFIMNLNKQNYYTDPSFYPETHVTTTYSKNFTNFIVFLLIEL